MTFLSSRVDILNGPATAKNYAFLISPTYEKRLKNLQRKRGKTIVREKKKKMWKPCKATIFHTGKQRNGKFQVKKKNGKREGEEMEGKKKKKTLKMVKSASEWKLTWEVQGLYFVSKINQ